MLLLLVCHSHRAANMLLEAEAQHLQMVQAKLQADRLVAAAAAEGVTDIDDEL